MKIHMDYLENKVEQCQNRERGYLEAIEQLKGQLEVSQDKVTMIKEARAQETKETTRKLEEYKVRHQMHIKRIQELER